jgi:hypothetical protein
MDVTWYNERYALLNIPLSSENMMLLAAMPGNWQFEGRLVRFKLVGANIDHIVRNWPDAVWRSGTDRFLNEWKESRLRQQEVIELKRKSELPEDPHNYQPHLPPYQHQQKAFLLSRQREYFALFMDPGTGKTKVTIDNAAYLYEQGNIDCLLVVAPNGVHLNWVIDQIPTHMPPRIPYRCYTDSGQRTMKQRAKFDQVMKHQGLAIFAFHIEGINSLKSRDLIEEVLVGRKCLWVIDESTRIKTPDAQRTKWILKHRTMAPYRRILTGTPVTKGIEDLYSQLLFLSPLILGFDTYTAFKARYCLEHQVGGKRGYTQITGYQNVPELVTKVDGCSFRVRKEECLDLPPKRYQRRIFELSPKASELYYSMAHEFAAEFEGQIVSEALAITRLLRLQQIASGWWPDPETDRLRLIDDKPARLTTLLATLEDMPEDKVIIWARFQSDFALLESTLGSQAVSYHGGVNETRRQQNLDKFRNDPAIKYFIANPQNAGVGLTINEAQVQIWYCNQFDIELRIQGEDRSHRIGQQSSVLYVDLEARRTLDGKIIRALRQKKSIADLITQDPKSFFLGYEE